MIGLFNGVPLCGCVRQRTSKEEEHIYIYRERESKKSFTVHLQPSTTPTTFVMSASFPWLLFSRVHPRANRSCTAREGYGGACWIRVPPSFSSDGQYPIARTPINTSSCRRTLNAKKKKKQEARNWDTRDYSLTNQPIESKKKKPTLFSFVSFFFFFPVIIINNGNGILITRVNRKKKKKE